MRLGGKPSVKILSSDRAIVAGVKEIVRNKQDGRIDLILMITFRYMKNFL